MACSLRRNLHEAKEVEERAERVWREMINGFTGAPG